MGKKKGQSGGQHAQNSFLELVSNANRNALKPYILEVVGNVGNDISRRVMGKVAILGNRIEALETVLKSKLDLTQVELDTSLYDLEDGVTGYRKVDRVAQEGDLLRLTMRVKNSKGDWSRPTKKEFANLGRPPFKMGIPDIEQVLLGVETGASATYTFKDDEIKQATGGTQAIEFTVERISEKIPPPPKPEEPKKEEPQNGENQDAAQPAGSPAPEQTSRT
jgi:hypothetical protein